MTGMTVTMSLPLEVLERGLHIALLAELDQVARGRERQLEASVFASLQRFARRYPDRVGGFPAVMGAELVRRSGGEEEPGVETFRHAFRRDPVRVGYKLVEREHHAVIGKHLQEGDLAIVQIGAMRGLDRAGALRIEKRLRTLGAGQENAALLKVSRIAAIRKLNAAASSPSPPL